MSIVAARTRCYRYAMCAALESLGVPPGRVHFVDGSSFDLSKEFNLEMYRLSTLVDQQEVKATGAECWAAARLSPMWCPCFVLLAEEYLDADFQFGGLDQASHDKTRPHQQALIEFDDSGASWSSTLDFNHCLVIESERI
jgi:tyrosyl-tRNA synthetase